MKSSNTTAAFLTKYFFIGAVVALLLLTVATRFYKLSIVPGGFTWDEAAIGYNGYGIITARRDEWLVKLPISFRSFGDYKAPLAIYVSGVFTYVFGMTEWSVRAPFAIAGVLFVFAVGVLINELARQSNLKKEAVLIGMLLAVMSPWHFHFSRVGFESGIAVALVTGALALLLIGKRLLSEQTLSNLIEKKLPYFTILGGVLLLIVSLYTYHSAKITVPFLVLYLVLQFRTTLKTNWIYFVGLTVVSALMLYPLIQDTLYGSGATRANVLLFSQQLSSSEIAITTLVNTAKHFSPDFLLFGKVDFARHGAGKWGILSIPTFLLLLGLVGSLVYKSKFVFTQHKNLLVVGLLLLITGILPAALSAETVPHSNRAMLALPGFIILAVAGFLSVLDIWAKNTQLVYRVFIGLIIFIECAFFLSFWQHYFSAFASESTEAFQERYIPAMKIARDYEKGINGKPEVDKVIVSTEYGQPYIYALFVKKPSPIAYQGGTLYKYEFSEVISSSDLERNNTLIVATPRNNMPADKATEIIKGSDGSTRFEIYYTGRK